MSDPLAGKRDAMNSGEIQTLIFPGDQPCPVVAGQEFQLRGCVVVMDPPKLKLRNGVSEWQVRWLRIEKEKVHLLRRTTPGFSHEKGAVKDPTEADITAAREAGAYTADPKGASVHEPEAVLDEKTAAKFSTAARLKQAERRRDQANHKREIQRLKARTTQVATEASRKGRDLTPLLDDIYKRLAEEERETREAA